MIKNLKIFNKKEEKAETKERNAFDDILSDIIEYHLEDETWNGYDFFLDNKHIEHTLKKYNYDYKRLMRRLTIQMKLSQLQKAIIDCGLDPDLIFYPTKESFEIMRLYVMYGIKPEKKYPMEPPYTGNPMDDILNDVFEYGMEDETVNSRYDIFLTDEYIANTLRKYHNNYKRLLERLLSPLNSDEIENILSACELKEEDLKNPTAEVFETIRYYYFHGKIKKK